MRSIVKKLDSTAGFFGKLQEITEEEPEDDLENTTLMHSTCRPVGLPFVLADLLSLLSRSRQPQKTYSM